MLSVTLTEQEMISELNTAIKLIENNGGHVRLSMECDPMFIDVTTIHDPIKRTLHNVRLVIEIERYM